LWCYLRNWMSAFDPTVPRMRKDFRITPHTPLPQIVNKWRRQLQGTASCACAKACLLQGVHVLSRSKQPRALGMHLIIWFRGIQANGLTSADDFRLSWNKEKPGLRAG
jgi:hypothetical protein